MPDAAKSADGEATGREPGAGASAGGPAPPARRRRLWRRLLGWIVAGLALLLVGALIGFFIARAQSEQMESDLTQTREELGLVQRALAQAEERNWNYYRQNRALEAALEAAQTGGQLPTPASEPPDGAAGGYGDGVYLVGEDIPPGAYDGVVIGDQGYWARLKGTEGLVSQIIANAVPKGPFLLTIVESDKAVELRGVRLTPR